MNPGVVLAVAASLIVVCACGRSSGRSSGPGHDAGIPSLDVVLYNGVKNVTAMVSGPDGNLWLATSDGTIARTTIAGETEVFPIGVWQSGHTSLARGPDGYLWLGNSICSECSLARVATDGTITAVLVEDNLRSVECLTNAADGSVWFSADTSPEGRVLARVTANDVKRARVVNTFDCGQFLSTMALVIDPDDNAWLTGLGCEDLLRVTPDGQTAQMAHYSSSCIGCPRAPDILVVGSDGNVWFPLIGGGSTVIMRMSPTGSSSHFSLKNTAPDCMALGPDGNIWFASGYSPCIGRITPSGEVSDFALPDGVIAGRIAAGPDGNLWLALKDGRIARVSL